MQPAEWDQMTEAENAVCASFAANTRHLLILRGYYNHDERDIRMPTMNPEAERILKRRQQIWATVVCGMVKLT